MAAAQALSIFLDIVRLKISHLSGIIGWRAILLEPHVHSRCLRDVVSMEVRFAGRDTLSESARKSGGCSLILKLHLVPTPFGESWYLMTMKCDFNFGWREFIDVLNSIKSSYLKYELKKSKKSSNAKWFFWIFCVDLRDFLKIYHVIAQLNMWLRE